MHKCKQSSKTKVNIEKGHTHEKKCTPSSINVNITNKIEQLQKAINKAKESNIEEKKNKKRKIIHSKHKGKNIKDVKSKEQSQNLQIEKQEQTAKIYNANVFIIGSKNKYRGELCLGGIDKKIKLKTDTHGNLFVNDKKMECREITDGLKLYVIKE